MKYLFNIIIFTVALLFAFSSAQAASSPFDRLKNNNRLNERKSEIQRNIQKPEINNRFQQEMCRPVGKSAAMRAASSRSGGKVLSAFLSERRQPPVYRVKVLSNSGRVSYITVNACNGMVIG